MQDAKLFEKLAKPDFSTGFFNRIFQKVAGDGKPIAIPSCNQIQSHLLALGIKIEYVRR